MNGGIMGKTIIPLFPLFINPYPNGIYSFFTIFSRKKGGGPSFS
jgi:hypothetical protein